MSSLMKHAETLELRAEDSNPCRGLRRRKAGFEACYLTDAEFAALGQALDDAEGAHPVAVAALRFLLYTGARKSEALRLKWEHVHGDHAALPDSKTGPWTICLASQARVVLAALPRRHDCPWVFASGRGNPLKVDMVWRLVREAAGWGRCEYTTCATRMRRSRSTAARAFASSPGCPAMPTSPPPSATRTLRRVRCWTPRTGSRAALPGCSTAGRRTMTERPTHSRLQPNFASASTRSTIPPGKASCSGSSRTARGPGCSVSGATASRRGASCGKARRAKGRSGPCCSVCVPHPREGRQTLSPSGPTLSRFAAEYIERRSPSWKPSTVKATMSYLNSAILPALGHLRVGSVARADVARFFHEYGHRRPGGANRCHEILRNLFDCAVGWGHRPEAPGTPARASSATGDRRAVGCSERTILPNSAWSCADSKANGPYGSRRCGSFS